jgi:hypothetical protein
MRTAQEGGSMRTCKYVVGLVFLFSISIPSLAPGQYAVPHDVVGSGGGQSTDGTIYLHDTIGQPAIGESSNPTNRARFGYWYTVDELHIGPTSAVAFAAFTAILSDDGVELHWEIGDASELEGFNVYRSVENGSGYLRLNESLLPADNNTFVDERARPGNVFWYRVGGVDRDGESMSFTAKVEVPLRETSLFQNYPNPFNPGTTIGFYLPEVEVVTIAIYDIRGKRVRQLVNEKLDYGKHQIQWNGENDQNELVGSGIYFFKMTAGKKSFTKKMILLK